MSCCGSRRQAYKAWLVPRPVTVRYFGSERITTVGRVTGNRYDFSPDTAIVAVDGRDAAELLRLPEFSLEDS